MKRQTWDQWVRACLRDKSSPIRITRNHMAMITGTDRRVLDAIAACWELYAFEPRPAMAAIKLLLPALQPKCWPIAQELIAFVLDWPDRDKVWGHVVGPTLQAHVNRMGVV